MNKVIKHKIHIDYGVYGYYSYYQNDDGDKAMYLEVTIGNNVFSESYLLSHRLRSKIYDTDDINTLNVMKRKLMQSIVSYYVKQNNNSNNKTNS